jgi:hypothetical protein
MVTGSFRKATRQVERDLSSIICLPPIGLTESVKSSFEEVYAPPETAIGLIGFKITQYGLRYEVFYKDMVGNDVCRFKVVYPSAQPYLHTDKTIGIAEKAHALMLIKASMTEERRENLKYQLNELEKACFDHLSGQVDRGLTGIRKVPNSKIIVEHIGLKFPADIDYETRPSLHVLMLEWVEGMNNMRIDNIGIKPSFTIGHINNPDGKRMYMTRSQAKSAIEYAKNYAQVFSHGLLQLGTLDRFWIRSEEVAEWMSVVPQPVP